VALSVFWSKVIVQLELLPLVLLSALVKHSYQPLVNFLTNAWSNIGTLEPDWWHRVERAPHLYRARLPEFVRFPTIDSATNQ
jgi:hypothetical protein